MNVKKLNLKYVDNPDLCGELHPLVIQNVELEARMLGIVGSRFFVQGLTSDLMVLHDSLLLLSRSQVNAFVSMELAEIVGSVESLISRLGVVSKNIGG